MRRLFAFLRHTGPRAWPGWIGAWLACCLGLLVPDRIALAAQQVLVVSSEAGGPYQAAAEALRAELAAQGRDGLSILLRALPELRDSELDAATIAVTLGTAAAQRLIDSGRPIPVYCALLPRAAFELFGAEGSSPRHSAIFLDQPFPRQLNLIELLLPGRTRLLALAGDTRGASLGALTGAAADRGLRVAIENVPNEGALFSAMTRRLAETDVLLALPDPTVLNARTVRGVLVTAYHYQVPVIAFSAAYVKAGALASVSSTPVQIGVQAARGVRQALAGRGLPAPDYPADFVVDVNETVARSFDLQPGTPEALRQRLLQMEGKP